MDETDEALASAASAGERIAYETLLRRHYARIFSLAWRLAGDYHEAQDLTQDLCLTLPRRLVGYRGQASFKSWLYRVIVNAVHDRRRAKLTRNTNHAAWGKWERDRQDEIETQSEALLWMRQALEILPDDLRDTAVLILDGAVTQAQVAQILDVSPGTVAWRMSEVKKHLRRSLSEEPAA